LWIRWKSNPIAFPAFDLNYDGTTSDEWFDFYYRRGSSQEMGQLTHTNSNCNDNFKVVLKKWRETYGDSKSHANSIGNRLPVFFDMEQSANVLLLSSWYQTTIEDSDIQVVDDNNIVTCCAKNPMHIISLERVGSRVSEYSLSEYYSGNVIESRNIMLGWLFDSYKYCQANGALLIPLYRF
jgi:hypothetical protein